MSRARFEIKGIPRLLERMRELPLVSREIMGEGLRYAQDRAQEFAKPHPVDKGTLAGGMKFEIAPSAVPLSGRVFTTSNIAPTVEEGRKPGQAPHSDQIRPWVESHRSLLGITGTAYAVAREIGRRGTRGVKFMARAVEETNKKLPEIVRTAEQRMLARWNR